MSAVSDNTSVLVAGAGIMGSGIAQVAAQAGHRVMLFDTCDGAATAARAKLETTLAKLVMKGKFTAEQVAQTMSRIEAVDSIDAAASVGLVIEAIVENIEAKRDLFRQIEVIVSEDCVLATNTSSLSVTAIAKGLQRPERLVGMHFFNPVPVMKLVEVVSALQTSREVADSIYRLAETWGKVPVHARSTPGFIVNRIARPFYAETLALLQEQAATPAVLDACLRSAGFRMGPCELMDLIGHDTNLAVTRSVYAANFYDKRYAPSLVQQELVDGGLLGRKSGRGFYDYGSAETAPLTQSVATQSLPVGDHLMVHGDDRIAEIVATRLGQHDYPLQRATGSDWSGLQVGEAQLRLGDGRSATELASTLGTDIAVFDLPLTDGPGTALAWSPAAQASAQWLEDAPAWLALFGYDPQQVEDVPGLVVARTIAMLINEAADAVQQGICDVAAANAAMKLGVNYPAGPFEWLAGWDTGSVIALLDQLDTHYRGERYRVSPWLRRAAWQARNLT